MEMGKMLEHLLVRMEPIWSELEGSIQHAMESVLSYVDHKTQNLRRELADAIEKTITDSRGVPQHTGTGL
jgi:hypothetical protein